MKNLDKRTIVTALAVALILVVMGLGGLGDGSSDGSSATDASGEPAVVRTTPTQGDTSDNQPEATAVGTVATDPIGDFTLRETPVSDLPTMEAAELPPEAIVTLELIASDGPYPFRQDDGVFQNREGILPNRTRGHYHEYTVITPESDDRGARRIVSGEDGERYYTDDHYDSFRELVAS